MVHCASLGSYCPICPISSLTAPHSSYAVAHMQCRFTNVGPESRACQSIHYPPMHLRVTQKNANHNRLTMAPYLGGSPELP
jgi:hypothetical protein